LSLEREVDIQREILRVLERMLYLLEKLVDNKQPKFPTSISFKEISMVSATAGNTQVWTGVLAPAGATYPSDTVFSLVSSDPTVSPSVDPTGLIVTIAYPQGFVDNPASPFNVGYTASSASAGGSISATITPSAPASFPTGITFGQTT
jgi:hypothetical protein